MSYSDYRKVEVPEDENRPVLPPPEVALEWVRIDRLVIDSRYQRPLSPSNWAVIKKIAGAFDWAHFTPLLIAPLEDEYFALIDGQHRTHAALMAGYSEVPAMSMPLDHAEQALAFIGVNGTRTNITAFHIYRAAIAADVPWALAAEAAVSLAGCRLMTSPVSTANKKCGEIYCHVLVRKMIEAGQGDDLTRALRALRASRHGSDVWVWSHAFLQPWTQLVAGSITPEGDLVTFLNSIDMRQLDRAVARLQDKAEFRRLSKNFLYRRSLIAMLNRWASTDVAVA